MLISPEVEVSESNDEWLFLNSLLWSTAEYAYKEKDAITVSDTIDMCLKGKGGSEFEFVIEYDSTIIPIDVRKTKGTLASLAKFKDHNKLFIAIKISEGNLGYDATSKMLTVPFYDVPFLIQTLKKGAVNEIVPIEEE